MATKNNINEFQEDINRVYKSGKIVRIETLPTKDGVNLLLDSKICNRQAETITRYITQKYDLEAFFYKKTHAIKVIYKKDV
jgi:hypothetical protein